MRQTRFMTVVFVLLSLAFFCLEDFRWSLQAPLLALKLSRGVWSPLEPLVGLPEKALDDWDKAASERNDAAEMAFVAMHLSGKRRQAAERLAERAVQLDPRLTWVLEQVARRHESDWNNPEVVARFSLWVETLEAFDPTNAVPVLLRAELIRAQQARGAIGAAGQDPTLTEKWLAAMDQAFRRLRYDDYAARRFALERAALARHKAATPTIVVSAFAEFLHPDPANIQEFAAQAQQAGRRAQAQGRLEEALARYRLVATFGRRMATRSSFLFEEAAGLDVERAASQALASALGAAGRSDEGALEVERTLALSQRAMLATTADPLEHTSNYYWSAWLLLVFSVLVVLFALLTIVCVFYVNIKRWWRQEVRGSLYQCLSVAENYMPLVWFLSCLALYLTYAPYASNFRHYMSARQEVRSIEPFFSDVLPNLEMVRTYHALDVARPLRAYAHWAAPALLLAFLLALGMRRRPRPAPAAAASAGEAQPAGGAAGSAPPAAKEAARPPEDKGGSGGPA